ncbi:DUF1801 domain-containing protein [Amaricoccus macauensis]|uniref:DUF1801 domain-containing protein n=1 Tax=Amaricoccus macauensis TaxID=57001 RepID=UPI003C7BE541
MQSNAATAEAYIDEVPAERRADFVAVLDVVRSHMPDGYVEAMNWGMICWEVPLSVSGKTYNGKPLMYVALASQKRHMALYLCGANCLPGVKDRLAAAFDAAGKKLDMGAACLRFRRSADLPLDAVGETIAAVSVARFLEASRR